MLCIVYVYIYHGKRTQTHTGMGMTDKTPDRGWGAPDTGTGVKTGQSLIRASIETIMFIS